MEYKVWADIYLEGPLPELHPNTFKSAVWNAHSNFDIWCGAEFSPCHDL
jgi:hypothetical protein